MKYLKITSQKVHLHDVRQHPYLSINFSGFQPYEGVRVLHEVDSSRDYKKWRVLFKKDGHEVTEDWPVEVLMLRYIEMLHEEINLINQYTSVTDIQDFRVHVADDTDWHDICRICGSGYSQNEEDNVLVHRAYVGYDDDAPQITLCNHCAALIGLEYDGDEAFSPVPVAQVMALP